jgi:hypothetical protein
VAGCPHTNQRPMRLLAYFLVPTLIGWLAGSAMCLVTMAVFDHTMPAPRDVTLMLTIAGLFIVAPTYLLFVMPYSFLCRRYFREHKDRLPWWPLSVLLFAVGGTLTFFPCPAGLGCTLLLLLPTNPSRIQRCFWFRSSLIPWLWRGLFHG